MTLPLVSEAPNPNDPALFDTINPFNPWKARLLFDTPIGGVKKSDETAEYLL